MNSYDIDSNGNRTPPPPWSESRYWIAGAVALAILILALRSLFPPAAPGAVDTTPTLAPTAAPSTAMAPLELAPLTPGPTAPAAAPPAPLPAPTTPATADCPAGGVLAVGERAGWLARAANCPQLVLANVAGERRWVKRPAELADDLYNQLPEVEP